MRARACGWCGIRLRRWCALRRYCEDCRRRLLGDAGLYLLQGGPMWAPDSRAGQRE